MPRAKRGFKARRRRNKVLKQAKGFISGRRRLIRNAMEAVDRSLVAAYRGRKTKKRDFRGLWQTRISAAAKLNGTSFSKLIGGLKKQNVLINRKMLAEIAANHPEDFAAIAELSKKS